MAGQELLADAVHALLGPGATGMLHTADRADAPRCAAHPTARGTNEPGGAADIAWEADALARAAGIPRAAHLAPPTADSLPTAQVLRLTAHAVTGRAHGSALARAIDLAAAAIADDPVTVPLAEITAGFRTALAVLPFPVMLVIIGVMTSTAAATTDDGPVTIAAGAARDRESGNWTDVADRHHERGNQTAQRQPARGGSVQRFREPVKAIRVHIRSSAAHAVRDWCGNVGLAQCRGTSCRQHNMWP